MNIMAGSVKGVDGRGQREPCLAPLVRIGHVHKHSPCSEETGENPDPGLLYEVIE